MVPMPKISLFGFSRGAYTARMTADFIVRTVYRSMMLLMHLSQGEVGVLDKHDMNYFANIFATCQKKNKWKNETGSSNCLASRKYSYDISTSEKEEALKDWAKYSFQIARGRKRADINGDNFTIKLELTYLIRMGLH
jgi:T6SS, Phospholipase effector Tle1-like, catalytic domain